MDERTSCILALALLLLFAGCLGGSTGDDAGSDSEWCHGLLTLYEETDTPVNDSVDVSHEAVQSTESIRQIIEQYRENGSPQRMGVWNESAKATSSALGRLDAAPENIEGPHVQLNSGTVVDLGLAVNGSLCGRPL